MDRLSSILRAHTVADGESDAANKILGAALVVVSKDRILYSGSAGRSGFEPSSEAWTPNTFTWFASVTKLSTSICLMQLVESGRLNLHDDLRTLVPELGKMQILRGFDDEGKPILEDNDRPITLRHLITHTEGLGIDLADPELMRWSTAIGRKATNLDWSLDGYFTPLKFPPGDGWYYGTAIDWAAQALERLTGQRLSAYMAEHILRPLGMNDTTFWPETLPHVAARTADFAFRADDKKTLRPGPSPVPKEHQIESGGAGLFSTAADYAKVLQAVLAGDLLAGGTMDQMFTPQLDERQKGMLNMIAYHYHDAFAPEFPQGLELNWGYGGLINMVDVPEKRRKGSLTWSGMCNSRWWIDRESNVAAIMVVNVLPHGDPVVKTLWDELERAVYADLLPKP